MEFKTIAAASVVLGLLTLVLNTAYTRGHTAGMSKVLAEWEKADKKRTESTAQAFAALIDRSNHLQTQLDTQALTHHQENAHAAQELTRLRSTVRAGSVRLSIPTTAACPTSPGTQNASSAIGPDPARTELDPATADDIVAITADGDQAIRDLNTCIEHYNTVRRAINAPVRSSQE